MELLSSVGNFIIFQILDQAPIFLGLITLVGMLLQKSKGSEIFDAVIKTVVGMLILSAGANLISGTITPVMQLLNNVVGVSGVMPMNEAAFGVAMASMAETAVTIFVFGFLIHLVLVYLIPNKGMKNVYLTAHMMLYLAIFLALTVNSTLGIEDIPLIVVSSVLAALYWTFTPAIPRALGKKYFGEDFTLGHAQQFGTLIGALCGKLFKSRAEEEDADNIVLPGGLYLFQDVTLALSLIMPILFVIIGVVVGEDQVMTLAGTQNWIIFLLMQGLQFAAGVAVMLYGVRMFLNSIIPAFKGISEKLIPNSVPALDCPVLYPYSPSGAMFGFLGSIPAGILVCLLTVVLGSSVVVFPSPIILFFDGCTIGVFGNKYGGWKGALLGGFVSSLIAHFAIIPLYPMMGSLFGSGLMFSNIDYAVLWLPLLLIFKFIGSLI
ncbi:PTS system ascorbate-specific IIC component [Olsenella profusa DSM 13989]|uniref:PTS ascorbate transporter subunit IIC n=1 Tax=Olsenella profusa TaxID=138595 RepID=UPI002786B70D|nr:PTS transporter subunit IIC [Olsenella profusa]MDP9859667.1 PTS system ascorbate-specific IIC component [Olsenella profusa DSM 13989]